MKKIKKYHTVGTIPEYNRIRPYVETTASLNPIYFKLNSFDSAVVL
jgi:hypothetical protein